MTATLPASPELTLEPCPFCGAGETIIKENAMWTGMKYGEPTSVEVRHWCPKIEGQPAPRMLAVVGRDRVSAIAAWNRRSSPSAEWRGIDTAPKDGTKILLWLGDYAVSGRWLDNEPGYSGAGWITLESREGFYAPHVLKYWMPLEPPK